MSKNNNNCSGNRTHFHCKSDAQKFAIKANYARRAKKQADESFVKQSASNCVNKAALARPIGIIPYDLGKAKCDYADALKAQDLAMGKMPRPDKYYHDKAWKALDMDAKLKERGFM